MPTDLPERKDTEQETQGASKGTLKGWHVLTIMLSLFGVVFAVNGYFIYMAVKTNSGEIGHAYLEGLKFNETLNARKLQESQGWEMSLSMTRGAGGDALFTATMNDKESQPVGGLAMNGKVYRNTDNKDDHDLKFTEIKAGVYEARVPRLGPGKWEFAAKASKTGNPDFTTETSLSIR